jgi:hypothetical protein
MCGQSFAPMTGTSQSPDPIFRNELCCFLNSCGLRGAPTVQSRRKDFGPCDHEYLNFKGTKLSKSRGAFVEVPYFLSKYDPDALRFYLTATAPETRDTPTAVLLGGLCRAEQPCPERSRRKRARGDVGPLRVVNRMLSFAYKRFEGKVPEPGELDAEDRALLEKVEAGFQTVGELYNTCKFRAALGEALAPPKALTTCGPRGQRLHIRSAQCRPGP